VKRFSGALLTNIRQGWKGLPGTKTLPFYFTKKSFFLSAGDENKLECCPQRMSFFYFIRGKGH
jgi:hypothetical protein